MSKSMGEMQFASLAEKLLCSCVSFPVLPIFGTKLKFSEPKLPARCSSFCKLIQFCSILRHSFCLSAVSLSRQRHNILGFAYYPSSRVLHVILANPQIFGFEFHLRSLPCAFSRRSVNQLVVLLLATIPSWRDSTRSPGETAVNDCNSWLLVWILWAGSH